MTRRMKIMLGFGAVVCMGLGVWWVVDQSREEVKAVPAVSKVKVEPEMRVEGGVIVKALPGVSEEMKREAFKSGVVLRVYRVTGGDSVWVVEPDRVTIGVQDLVRMLKSPPPPWHGKTWKLEPRDQEKVRECLDRLREKVGYSYDYSEWRHGRNTLVYGTADATGPLVLWVYEAELKALDDFLALLYRTMGKTDMENMPVLEDARVTEVMERAKVGSRK